VGGSTRKAMAVSPWCGRSQNARVGYQKEAEGYDGEEEPLTIARRHHEAEGTLRRIDDQCGYCDPCSNAKGMRSSQSNEGDEMPSFEDDSRYPASATS